MREDGYGRQRKTYVTNFFWDVYVCVCVLGGGLF